MIVRRFVNWLKVRIAAATALRHRSREIERVPALSRHSVSNWLDNGRRLRPVVARNTIPAEAPAAIARVSYETSAPAPEKALAVSQPCEPTLKSQSGGTSEIIPSSSPPAATETHPSLLEGIEQLDATQRGLVYLKYLVRHGVYNEGYSRQDLPDQYHHSAGLDEPRDERN
jgi:hypothetical protein